jgi:hypothetical protein
MKVSRARRPGDKEARASSDLSLSQAVYNGTQRQYDLSTFYSKEALAEAASGNFILAEMAIMQILTLFITSAANYVVVLNNICSIYISRSHTRAFQQNSNRHFVFDTTNYDAFHAARMFIYMYIYLTRAILNGELSRRRLSSLLIKCVFIIKLSPF